MNFAELKTELFARGLNYLEESAAEVARAEFWLNTGYREVCNLQNWSFLEATATGPAPLSVPDFRKAEYVLGSDGLPLTKTTRRDLVRDGWKLTDTGTPIFYYLTQGTIFNVAPVSTSNITVAYFKRIAPMTGTDVPVFDEEYHNVIVDKAMLLGYTDSDNFEARAALEAQINSTLAAMSEDYLLTDPSPSYIEVVDPQDG